MSLSSIDYLVIAVYLLAITAFGSWFARYQKTTRDCEVFQEHGHLHLVSGDEVVKQRRDHTKSSAQ